MDQTLNVLKTSRKNFALPNQGCFLQETKQNIADFS